MVAAALIVVLGAGAPTAAATRADKVVLRVGVTQEIDSANPTVGVLVPSYEVWNLQYATLTEKAADDFHAIPGLAQSWTKSNDGRTYTYTLRSGLRWSDGEPLAADDVAYTINRARRERWTNYEALANVTARVLDARTVRLTSSVADPKLPTIDAYIVPKHVYAKVSAKALPSYDGFDGVASGPFRLTSFAKGVGWRMAANPTYWRGRPAVDEIFFRFFDDTHAMVDALRRGDIDFADDVPDADFRRLRDGKGPIVTVQGVQGSFNELALNSGAGLGGHPALRDVRVRRAIAHAIDKRTIVANVEHGLATPADTMTPSADPAWTPTLKPNERLDFDVAQARRMLDDAGYDDTNGDGVREMPGGGQPLRFTYGERSESAIGAGIRRYVTAGLRRIGIATTVRTYTDTQLTAAIGKGDVDVFAWGWTPFVDPDPMLSYFTCDQVASDPRNPTNFYNDASWCNKQWDRLYASQHGELDRQARVAIVHRMLKLMYREAPYVVLDNYGDLQAYRADRFTGWVRQPAKTGPIAFSNTSPSYFRLRPVAPASKSSGSPAVRGVAVGAIAAVVVGGGALLVIRRRRARASGP